MPYSAPGAGPPPSDRTRTGLRRRGCGHGAGAGMRSARCPLARPAAPPASAATACPTRRASISSAPSVSFSTRLSVTASRSARLRVSVAWQCSYASSTSRRTAASIRASIAGDAVRGASSPLPSSVSHATGPPPKAAAAKPHCATICRASARTRCKSLRAPVVTSSSPYTTSSATRPPSATASRALRCASVYIAVSSASSLGVKSVKPPAPLLRGTMVTFVTAS
mmetsp:Transcript_14809/g.48213  ORF Transcript_14809/g.48213 Transcript_14809/m.48213 type:complete len:224 (+) Transcript_14809:203-874(+)